MEFRNLNFLGKIFPSGQSKENLVKRQSLQMKSDYLVAVTNLCDTHGGLVGERFLDALASLAFKLSHSQ